MSGPAMNGREEGGGDAPAAPWARLFGRIQRHPDPAPAAGEDGPSRVRGAFVKGAPRLLPNMDAPRFPRRIETQRLDLDLPRAEDLPSLVAMTAEPSMFRYSERGAMSREETWNLLLRHVGHWLVAGYGAFAVRERDGGRLVGLVGASVYHRDLGPGFDDFPEMTWSIAAAFRGRGYATEAAAAVIEAFDAQPSVAATVSLIHVDNQPSLRVAAKLGYRFFERCEYRGYPAGLFCR